MSTSPSASPTDRNLSLLVDIQGQAQRLIELLDQRSMHLNGSDAETTELRALFNATKANTTLAGLPLKKTVIQ